MGQHYSQLTEGERNPIHALRKAGHSTNTAGARPTRMTSTLLMSASPIVDTTTGDVLFRLSPHSSPLRDIQNPGKLSFRAQRGICEASRLAVQVTHCLQRYTFGRFFAPLRSALNDRFCTLLTHDARSSVRNVG